MSTEVEDSIPAKRAVFSVVARESQSLLLGRAVRLTGADLDWAKDLVQETLVAGYSALLAGEIEIGPGTRAWLLRTLTNRFINQYRRKRVLARILEAEGVDTVREQQCSSSPDHALMQRTLSEPLQAALDSLPEDQRICVLLVDIEKWEYAEVARMLEIPTGTVRSRLARAREKLYDLLRLSASAMRSL